MSSERLPAEGVRRIIGCADLGNGGYEIVSEVELPAESVATWTCPTCGLVYPTQEDMKLHAVGHLPHAKYSDWGDDWVERCDNLMDQNEKLEHDLGIRWGERNEALDALRALLADYEKVVQIAVSAGFRAPRMASPAAQRAANLLAHIDGLIDTQGDNGP